MKMKIIFTLVMLFIFYPLFFTQVSHATTNVVGADPVRHDRFYLGADKNYFARQYDFSGVGKIISSSSKWATMVTDSYFVSARHSHPVTGDVVRFYYTNDSADGYVDRIVAGGLQVSDNFGSLNGDLWLGYFSEPVPEAIKKYPLLGSGLSNPPVGSKLLLFGKANNSAVPEDNPTNQRSGRNICASTSTFTYSYTFSSTLGAGDSLGVDENMGVQGDSGSPTFVLVDNQLALVGTRWFTTGDMSVISRSQSLNNEILSLSGGLEQVSFIDIPPQIVEPLMLEGFEAETLGASTSLKGQPTTVKHELANLDFGGSATIVSSQGNKRLVLSSTSNVEPDSPKAFLEAIADSIAVGNFSVNIEVDPIGTAPLGQTIFTVRAGDDLGNNEITVGGANMQAVFQVDFMDNGFLTIHTLNGVFTSDQLYTFGQPIFLVVDFDLHAGGFSVYVDGKRITSSQGAISQFVPMTSVDVVDAVFFVAHGIGSSSTSVFLDNVRIGVPGGWVENETIIPLNVEGASLESDAVLSGDWAVVTNATGSVLEITRGGAHEGNKSGISVGGINGLNVSE
ncbi:MAG: hypothetical protein V3T17_19700, partial [Pseudomonadales bacterium]